MKSASIHIIRVLFYMTFIFTLSCTDETLVDEILPSVPKGSVRIEMFTNSVDYQKPILKAGTADENTVSSTPWVLVFSGNDNNAVFVEAQQSIISNEKTYITLKSQNSDCKLLVIANPPSSFYNGTGNVSFDQATLNAELSGKSFSEAVNNTLLTTLLASPIQTTVPYTPNKTLPMSNVLDVTKINGSTTIGTTSSKLQLSRIVAKATVINTDVNFNLEAAAIINSPRNGRLYQNGTTLKDNSGNITDYLTASTGDGVTGIAPTGGLQNTNANPIYIYESAADEQTSLIIKGTYNSTSYYYKLAFSDENGTLLDVFRNHYYEFTIAGVTGPGHKSVDDAKTSPPSNIKYSISVTDMGSHDIMDNGQYYLGVSNSELIEYAPEGQAINNILALTVYTDAPTSVGIRQITADSPDGQLTLLTTSINVTGALASTDVYINMGVSFTSGTITLQLGNLIKTILVLRNHINYAGLLDEYFPEYTSGDNTDNDWINFSTDGHTFTPSLHLQSSGSIQVLISPNIGHGAGSTRTGFAYLSQANNQGRVKINVHQEYEEMAVFTILCDNSVVNGVYQKDKALDQTNTIKLVVNVISPGIYEISTKEIDGISFKGSSKFIATGLHDVILQGTGTPNSLLDKNMVLMSSNGMTCSIGVQMTLPKKRILAIGTYSSLYAYNLSTGFGYTMLTDKMNFGTDPKSIVKFEGFEYQVTRGDNSPDAATFSAQIALKPDIVVIGVWWSPTDAQAQLLADYLAQGGVVLAFMEELGGQTFLRKVFNSVSVQQNGRNGAGAMYRYANIDDEVLKGPFFDLRGLQWGEDASVTSTMAALPSNDIIVYSTDADISGTSNGVGNVTIFRHKTLNLIYCADGGFNSNKGASDVEYTLRPFIIGSRVIDGITYPNYPTTKLYGRGTRYQAYNAPFTANALAWAIRRAQFNGINK